MRKKRPIDVLFPRIRQEVLAATLLHPEKWWYLTDLARHLGRRPSSLQRELGALVEAGILRRKKEGKEVFYQAEPQCPILTDLQGLLTKTVGLVDVLRDALEPFQRAVDCAFVYGSVARGREAPGSDVDLMIIGEAKLSEMASVFRRAEGRLGRRVNPTVYAPGEFAEKVRAGHHFLRTVLAGEKLFVVGSEDDLARYGASGRASSPPNQSARAG